MGLQIIKGTYFIIISLIWLHTYSHTYNLYLYTILIQSYKLVGSCAKITNNQQLLEEVEQNIMICLWQADQLFAEAEG